MAPKLGTAVHEYRHGVMDTDAGLLRPPRCRRTGRCRIRRTTGDVLRRGASRPRSRDAGIDPAQVIGIATDFTRVHAAAGAGRRHAAVRVRRSWRDRPHAYPKLWKHHASPAAGGPDQRGGARAGRAVARPLRREDLRRVAVRQGAAAAGGGPGASTSAPTGGSRPPTGSSGSCAGTETRNACTAGYKGIYQDGHYPLAGVPGRAGPATSPGSPTTSWPTRSPRSAGAGSSLTPQRPRLDRPAQRDRAWRSATWTRTCTVARERGRAAARWWRSWAPRPAT